MKSDGRKQQNHFFQNVPSGQESSIYSPLVSSTMFSNMWIFDIRFRSQLHLVAVLLEQFATIHLENSIGVHIIVIYSVS